MPPTPSPSRPPIEPIKMDTSGASPVLTLLDQRHLPNTTTHLHLTDAPSVATAIQTMVVRGAPAIGVTAAHGLALAACAAAAAPSATPATFADAVASARATLLASRPTAVNLRWALERLGGVLDAMPADASLADRADALLREAERVQKEDGEACRAMGRFGATLVPRKGARIVHHCNTGALATSAYGTALGLIRAAFEVDQGIHVYVDETRPRLQGARLTAWELVQEGISHELVVDSAAAVLMREGKVDMVVVGADRIARDGAVANKIGTYGLAVNAKYHGIRFVVVAPVSTVDLEATGAEDIPIEERGKEEVTHPCGEKGDSVAPDETPVLNFAFDVTPPELVSFIVTERGIAKPPFADSLKELCEKK